METLSDTQHMHEIYSLYYPGASHAPPKPPSTDCPCSPGTPAARLQLNLLPYTCCGNVYANQNHALVHYFQTHFRRATKPDVPEFSLGSLGDKRVPIFVRTQLFLDALHCLPQNPARFRPAPLAKQPTDFPNPYSATLAMAYDFISVVVHNPVEYSRFTFMLRAFHPVSSHKEVWPYWAHYFYPSLSSPPPSSPSSE